MIFELHIIFHHRLNEREWKQFLDNFNSKLDRYNLKSKGKLKGRIFDAEISDGKSKLVSFINRWLFLRYLKSNPIIDRLDFFEPTNKSKSIFSAIDYNKEAMFI